MDFLAEARAVEPEMIKTRRAVHQKPELSYHEVATAKLVADRLESLGIKVRRGVGGTGVVGVLKGAKKGRVVGLRADMDALPVDETSDVEFKSKVKGVMHACGHDTHVAMLLAAARILSEHRDELHGTVKFLFQPAEEHGGRGGAKPMIEDGAMKDPKVDYVFGLHIGDTYHSGELAVKPGAIMAAPDSFKIRVVGKGGHGAYPHETVDPVYIAAQVILALQGVSGRMIDPVQPFVVSVCSVHAGTKDNIIPDDALLEGTIRTLDKETRRRAKSKVGDVVAAVAKAFGGRAEVSFMEDAYPVTYNDPKTSEKVAEVLGRIPGAKVKLAEQVLGGEDFSRFLEEAPGAFYFLGTRNEAKGCVHPNHSSKFKVDEDVLKLGAASLAMLAMEFANRVGP
ncbi:MAG TPA: carboxypeptidase CpsA [Nitrososphaerales archaeon]|nr:carboxypeptidase CpsA [Nitrososphaerales archaeon]